VTTGKSAFDAAALRDAFYADRLVTSQRARWDASDPGAPSNVCRFCGKPRQWWAISKLDGHAACIVSDDFKRRVGEILRSPTVTYKALADTLGLTIGVIRSWAVSAGIAGPITHELRNAAAKRRRP
jgi:hypothetical protein